MTTRKQRSLAIVRPVWIPGIQYGTETAAQMEAREARLREADRRYHEQNEWWQKWKATPWWLVHTLPPCPFSQ